MAARAGTVLAFNVAAVPADGLQGRKKLERALQAWLDGAGRRFVLFGPGGTGKSTLALKFAAAQVERGYCGGLRLVFVLSASSMAPDYAGLRDTVLGASAGRAQPFEEARAVVHEVLRSAEWSGKWLAVLDDMAAPAEMEGAGLGWMLGEFPWAHGRTIITTRAAEWAQEEEESREVSAAEQRRCDQCGRGGLSGTMQKCGRCRLAYYCSVDCQTAAWGKHKGACAPRRSVADVVGLSVEGFGEEEACAWLQSTVRQWRGDETGVLELVQHIGCLPLAVGQVSAFASTHKTATAGEYLAALKRAAPTAAVEEEGLRKGARVELH